MLFSSPEFIFVFLPVVFLGYHGLATRSGGYAARWFLIVASLFFYAWWKPIYLPLMLSSIGVNYGIGRRLIDSAEDTRSRFWLIAGVVFNLGLLGYFKYSWFVVETFGQITGSGFRIEPCLLPLAISFLTFQQIAFLVDAHLGKIRDAQFSTYALFVSFFPQLIAGPIVHHKEMMPQFERAAGRAWPSGSDFRQGLQIFIIGLAKKVVIADALAVYVDQGWGSVDRLDFYAAWATTLAYSFQLL